MGTDPSILQELFPFCSGREFQAGELLRKKGQHYREMFLIKEGTASVDLVNGKRTLEQIQVRAGDPVGEICFLQGVAATASVTATSDLKVLSLNDQELAGISRERPDLYARLLRNLAETASERLSFNLSVTPDETVSKGAGGIEILLCRSKDQWRLAKRLRFDVYCCELGRSSPGADHDERVITDELDLAGHCFIAEKQGKTIGTLRVNYASEGPLNGLETIYGMINSPHYPNNCGICTKFIVDKTNRGGPTAFMLIAQAVQLGVRDGMRECYIDCIQSLSDYYCALGFEVAAPEFLHPENGPSVPMKLDLEKHGAQMSGRDGLRRMIRLFLKARAGKAEAVQ